MNGIIQKQVECMQLLLSQFFIKYFKFLKIQDVFPNSIKQAKLQKKEASKNKFIKYLQSVIPAEDVDEETQFNEYKAVLKDNGIRFY